MKKLQQQTDWRSTQTYHLGDAFLSRHLDFNMVCRIAHIQMRVSILCIDTICMANDMCTYVKRDRRIDIERERRAVWASDS